MTEKNQYKQFGKYVPRSKIQVKVAENAQAVFIMCDSISLIIHYGV